MAVLQHRTLAVDDLPIHLVESGRGAPVLFLHGAGSTWTAWSLTVAALAHRFRSLAPDLPGFGDSGSPGRYWPVSRFAHFIHRMLDDLAIPQAHIVGNSFGAVVAADVASTFPDRVQSLTLVAPPAMDAEASSRTLLSLLHLMRDDGVPRFETVEEARLISPHASEELLLLANQNFAASRLYLEVIAAAANYPYRKRLGQVHCRTLMVWGDQDGLVPAGTDESWRQALWHAASVRSEILSPAGHCPQFDVPKIFNRLLTDFLRGEPS